MRTQILLVEDRLSDVVLTRAAFRQNELPNEVVVARDGAEALDYLFGTGSHAGRDTRSQPGLILLNLNLPRVDGMQVLARLRRDPRTRLIPVVILTDSREEEDILAGYSLGANSYICKPANSAQLTDVVRQIGLYWLLLTQKPPPRPS
jgi:two-component system response regulator